MELSILIVDDDAEITDLLERVFARAGFTVHLAASAGDAWEKLVAEPAINVVLSDLRLPGESGTSFLRRVLAFRPELLACAMTGHLDEVEAGSLAQLGVEQVFLKPFSLFSPLVASIVAGLAARYNKTFVLVADDCRDFRRVARRALAQADFAVAQVGHLESLSEVLQEHRPAVVLADTMGEGAASLGLCRRHAGRVAFVSCSCMPAAERRAYVEAGATELLTKPVAPDGLVDAVRRNAARRPTP